jgi:phosphoribosylaminoimidazole-succinocarboxamide synthase
MAARTPIYEGKAKKLFEGPEPGTLIQYFKDDTTAFNNKKKEKISGKGVINNRISEFMFERLGEIGIPNHFIKRLNMREQLIYAVEIIPIEVIVRNYVAGSFAERFKAEEGEPIGGPLIEFCLKDDALGDPFIAEEHIYAFDLCDPMELEEIRLFTIRINDYLSGLFRGCGITLADMKLEFGRMYDENGFPQLMLADEISPDNCRLWDIKTGEKMDKDRFRRDLGDVSEYYREVATRLGISTGMNTIELVETDEEEATEKKKPVRKAPRKPAASRSKPKGKK